MAFVSEAVLPPDEVAIAGAANPVPALFGNEPEPGRAKACIGDDNRCALARRHQRGKPLDERLVNLERGQVFAWMHFFKERNATTVYHDRGPQ